jgi:hypothetical protein
MTPLAGHTYSFEQAREGLEHGLAVVSWAERFGLPVVNTAVGGHAHVEESEDAFLRDLPAIADRVANVHLKDMGGAQGEWDFPAIGQGHVDFARVIEILRGAGFEAPYSVEVEFTGGGPWPPLDEVNAAMRASREALAAHGLS